MDRRTTLVTAGVTALLAVTATAAVAVNTGLLSRPADDVAGTLELPQSVTEATAETGDTTAPDVETVYVDVYDQPAGAPDEQVVVVPAEPAAPPADEYGGEYDDEYDDEYDEYDDEYEDDGEYEHEEDEHEEYEGWDDDD